MTEKERQLSIVLRGTFNTRIFHPLWFLDHGLVGKSVAKMAENDDNFIIHESFCQLNFEWATIQIQPDRFLAKTIDDACDERLKDLVVNTFILLGHTPIEALGLNRSMHFEVKEEADWHKIGHKFVPKDNTWDKLLKNPGTRSVMVQGERSDGEDGYIMIKVEPSSRLVHGVLLDINNHLDFREKELKYENASKVSKILEDVWDESKNTFDEIINKILSML